MKIGTWLLALVSPLVARVLAALGFSVVTVTGMGIVFDQLKAQIVSGFGGLPADLFNLFLLAGGGQSVGIIMGAMAAKLALWQIQNATRILGVSN